MNGINHSWEGKTHTNFIYVYKDARVLEGNKPSKLQDQNVTNVSTGSNTPEISRAMGKISETNQPLAQQQMVQQRALQALLHHQEQPRHKKLHREYKVRH